MPIPFILPPLAAWALKVVFGAAAVKTIVWSGMRFVQHGLDLKATREQLRKDVSYGHLLAHDAAALLNSLRGLQKAKTFTDVHEAAKAIHTALAHLPTVTRTGLNNSVGLEAKIDLVLADALTEIDPTLLTEMRTKAPLSILSQLAES